MSASEFTNKPVQVAMDGNRYKVRRLPILAISSIAEQYVLQQRVDLIHIVAAGLNGDSMGYINAQTNTLPQGGELEALGEAELNKSDAFSTRLMCEILQAALIEDQPTMTVEHVGDIFREATNAEMVVALGVILGDKKKSPQKKH